MTAMSRTRCLAVLLCMTGSGCATVWTSTTPAISKESYDLQVLKVRPPLDPTWRLFAYDEFGSQVIFFHAETGDKLGAWWVPMTPEEVQQSQEATVLAYFKELFLEELQYHGDYELSVVTSREWTATTPNDRGRFIYLKGVQHGSQNFEAWTVYRERQFNKLPIVEVFSYSRALKSPDQAVGAETEASQVAILGWFVERALPGQADLQQVTWQRASTAYDRFRVLSEKRGQAKEKDRLAAAYHAATREIHEALPVLTDWPEIHDTAGLLASYNDEYEFLGKGFDAKNAEKAYLDATRLRQNFALAHLHLARMYHALEQWPEALAHYQALSDISPNSSQYQYEQGKLLEKLERPAEALGAYQHARRSWMGAVETRKELDDTIKALEKS